MVAAASVVLHPLQFVPAQRLHRLPTGTGVEVDPEKHRKNIEKTSGFRFQMLFHLDSLIPYHPESKLRQVLSVRFFLQTTLFR